MRLPNLSIKCPNDLPNRVCECMKTSVNHSQKWREVVESLKAETVVRAEGIVRDRPDEDINKVLLKYMSYLHIYTCILSFLHIVLPHIWMQFYQFSFIFLFFPLSTLVPSVLLPLPSPLFSISPFLTSVLHPSPLLPSLGYAHRSN